MVKSELMGYKGFLFFSTYCSSDDGSGFALTHVDIIQDTAAVEGEKYYLSGNIYPWHPWRCRVPMHCGYKPGLSLLSVQEGQLKYVCLHLGNPCMNRVIVNAHVTSPQVREAASLVSHLPLSPISSSPLRCTARTNQCHGNQTRFIRDEQFKYLLSLGNHPATSATGFQTFQSRMLLNKTGQENKLLETCNRPGTQILICI